jgi:uncharacterized protein YgiM (DUF1202 family)
MRPLLALLLLLQAFSVSLVHAKEQLLEVVVAEPYLEMHSGPGRGYPVVYVVGRDEVVTVLYSRTDWFKVRAPRGQEGWARRSELALTKLTSGEPAPIPPYPDFAPHRRDIDNRYITTLGIRHTFIPEWRWFSPTAGIGTGYQYIDDKVPPKPLQTSNQLAYVSLGARGFITRRFMWRADWRKYVVFTNQNQNEEPEEWKFGLAVFF